MTDLTGDWHGTIRTPGAELAVGITFTAAGGTAAVPAQGLQGLPLADVVVEGTRVRFAVPSIPGGARFTGTLIDDAIAGEYNQGGRGFPFTLVRGTVAAAGRPQEPQPPFPYWSEQVTFASGPVTLAGTLTVPPTGGPHPAVVLITGSGAHDRDESIAGHKPFLVLADALTRAGFAVLRVDDRGVGGSGGTKAQCSYDELALDPLAGISHLAARPDIDPARIGLCGHSEGGYLAPLAAGRAGGAVAFVVALAGPAAPGAEVLVLQNRLVAEQAGLAADAVEQQVEFIQELCRLLVAQDLDGARALARERITEQFTGMPPEDRPAADRIEEMIPVSPAFRAFVAYDPAPALAALTVPVLAVFGELDVQVPPAQSEPAMRALLAGNPDATVRTVAGVNHLMQPATTGAVTEYAAIATTIAPEVLALLTGWLQERFG
ncbi:alpha/beta hydrolase family protein [Pseudonocardia sp. GCM10023141]|uniref:alpha/beta hydrolase family protein n=1 Tax=Pseudonocardia sp. GCM10023141 TaxID=3252653 RepID=UPI003614534E